MEEILSSLKQQIDALLAEWRTAAKITIDEAVVELYRPENLIGQ